MPSASGRFRTMHRLRHARTIAWAVALLTVALAAPISLRPAAAQTPEAPYRLGSQDKLRVKVVEWRSQLGEFFEWTALTGEYTINPAGNLSLPLVGEFEAAGLTPEDLAKAVSTRLQTRVGLVQPPDTSIEIVQFRPFYIVGAVDKPGEYPFRPGLNVVEAVSIAGGFPRPRDLASWRLQRDSIEARGDMRLHAQEATSLKARKARLQAELQRLDAIAFPQDLTAEKANPAVSQAMAEEELIFKARREGLQVQIDALGRQRGFLEKEIESLTAQVQTETKQLELIQKELKNVSGLVERGLALAPRQLTLERSAAEIEGERLELQTTILRARQDLNKTERSIAELQGQRQTEVLAELRATNAKLEELAQKIGTSQRLVYEAEVIAPQAQLDRSSGEGLTPTYAIMRRSGDKVTEIAATETTAVQPGDTVKVRLPMEPSAPVVQTGSTAPAANAAPRAEVKSSAEAKPTGGDSVLPMPLTARASPPDRSSRRRN